MSLFSGAGVSDMGYRLAGFEFVVQVELDPLRAAIGQANFPGSTWLAKDVGKASEQVVSTYRKATSSAPLDLLVATPPCQGMSSSNPSRGKRKTPQAQLQEARNRLLLAAIPIASELKPRIIVAENVRQVLTHNVTTEEGEQPLIKLFAEGLPNYRVFFGAINVADYGMPQVRRRAVVVAVRSDQTFLKKLLEENLAPWPRPTHSENPGNGLESWITVRQWVETAGYQRLDAKCPETARGENPLHFVPHYGSDRYLMVSAIPAYSGKSAYENNPCLNCNSEVEKNLAVCPKCESVMKNRPVVEQDEGARIITGFHSSYRRMEADRPACTITTNTNHIGSDFKIHPWENRVLSILECADLQTVPRFFDWDLAFKAKKIQLIRELVGEAFPTYFTFLHGQVLKALLSGEVPSDTFLASRPSLTNDAANS